MLHAACTRTNSQIHAARHVSEVVRAVEDEAEVRPLTSHWSDRVAMFGGAWSLPNSPAGRLQPIAALQRTLGNHAVLRMLAVPASLKPKLTVNEPVDAYEQEADRVADQVMRMPDPAFVSQVRPSGTGLRVARHLDQPLVQRCGATPCNCSSEERAVHAAAAVDSTSVLHDDTLAAQRGPVPFTAHLGITAAPPAVHQVLRSSGQPLDEATRAFMEQRFGQDFSHVRVHTDARAAESARAVNALAYTVGQDMVFGVGEYAPGTEAGRRLLAHELTHVVQQTAGPAVAMGKRAGGQIGSIDARTLPQISRQPSDVVQRATKKGCVAPSFVVDQVTASRFGSVAETLVELDYLKHMGGRPFADVFFDNPLGPMSYVAFLVAHHPGLNRALLAIQIGLSGGVLVPDILDTRPGVGGAPEFYDVKPDSPDGRFAGRGKLAAIDAFMSANSLPYVRGSSYIPSPSIPIPLASPVLGAIIGLPLVLSCGLPIVTLEPRLAADGLLLYELCVEADLDCYLKVLALELLIAAIIVAILVAGGLIPLPIPGPVPVPVPVAADSEESGPAASGQVAAGGVSPDVGTTTTG